MHLAVPAGPRRRTRRALLAAALPAAIATIVVPASAHAATAQVIDASANGIVAYTASAGETNDVRVTVAGGKLVISDQAPIFAHSGCVLNVQGDAECPIGVDRVILALRDRDDVVRYAAPHAGNVSGEDGNDRFFGGIRQAVPGRSIQPLSYHGNAGQDTMSYALADRGVFVDSADGLANDGRPGDLESVHGDTEVLEGSNFGDTLFGSTADEALRGMNGNDVIAGGVGNDLFIATPGDGADDYHGGPDQDTISYAGHTRQLLIDLDNVADDGAPGENDNVRSNVENVIGGSGDDVIKSMGAFSRLEGRAGADTLVGGFGPDTLIGGTGADTLDGGTEDDLMIARDGEQDTVACGSGVDAVDADRSSPLDLISGCENFAFGVPRLAPRTLEATAGRPAHLRLSWRHPESWHTLRKIQLRLTRNGAQVAAVTIRPRANRIAANGTVALVRGHTRLTHNAKTVAARLALRLDERLAGETLTTEVEATDTRGRRQ